MMMRLVISIFFLYCLKESHSANIDEPCSKNADCEKENSACYSEKCKCVFPNFYDSNDGNCAGTATFCSNNRECAYGTCDNGVCLCDDGYSRESNCRLRVERPCSGGMSIKTGVTSLVFLLGSLWMLLK
ncbi:uncharacterized protein LOC134244310 [Saccostrea cucullata]|uniref:uncharacterized protein LOC134244310 n=1 Tax=Saccostrea cuccullata TaxID=36930 RepID=UPI002ED5B464